MKKTISLLLALCMILSFVPLTAQAAEASGTCGENLTWSLSANGTLTISGQGEMYQYGFGTGNGNYAPWYDYRESITNVVVEEGVTTLGGYSIYGLTAMKTISLPATLTSIDTSYHGIFSGCSALEKITVAEGNKYFYHDAQGALYNKIFDSLILVPDTFAGIFVIPEGVKELESSVFANCTKITGIQFPDSIVGLGLSGAFYGCTGLKTLTLPDGITYIGSNTFAGCTNLTSVNLPESVTNIEANAFKDCVSLKSLTIPAATTNFSTSGLGTCTSLAAIYVDDNNPNYFDLNGMLGRKAQYEGDSNTIFCAPAAYKGALTIPADVLVQWNGLMYATGITSFSVAEGHPELHVGADGALWINESELMKAPCTLSGTYTVPFDMKSIAPGAFNGCTDLEKIVFPDFCKPYLYANCFLGLTAEAHYPADEEDYWANNEYEGDMRKDYGGSMTWIADDTRKGFIAKGGGYQNYWKLDEAGVVTFYGTDYVNILDSYDLDEYDEYVKHVVLSTGITGVYGSEWGVSRFLEHIESVDFGKTVVEIEPRAFNNAATLNSVTFRGDAPAIGTDAFLNVTATCYYPEGNATWTVDVMQNYGGNLTWESYVPETDEDDVQENGWAQKDGQWYFYENGAAKTGWLKDGGNWYYLDASGVMQTGWVRVSGSWYYLGSDGIMQTGWVKTNGTWYYLSASGVMQTGWVKSGGSWYYMSSGGAMQTGWVNDGGKWYYMSSGGAMQTGWINDGGKWYYLNSYMMTGWQKIDGKWYYLKNEMKTGWQFINGKWYYLNTHMQTGWLYSAGKWYYLGADGAMVTGTHVIGGKSYTFNANGVWVG